MIAYFCLYYLHHIMFLQLSTLNVSYMYLTSRYHMIKFVNPSRCSEKTSTAGEYEAWEVERSMSEIQKAEE